MWDGERLIVRRREAKRMVDFARKAKGTEVCGVLIGWGTTGQIWWPVRNIHPEPEMHYQMDPDHQVRAWQWAERNSLRVVAVVHSHPHRDASLSTADIDYAAFGPDTFYAVLGMKPLELKAWTIADVDGDRKITPHAVDIDASKQGLGYCWSHHKYENDLRAFKVCFECGHVFATELELISAHNDVVEQINKNDPHPGARRAQKAEDVFCCPFCVHDF